MIDLELACETNAEVPCYDLYGPASGIPVPEQHRQRTDEHSTHGVWWHSPVDGLGKVFGPFAQGSG